MRCLELCLLGPFRATLAGGPITFPYDKVRALLAYLIVEAKSPHHREVLATLLWPNDPPAAARTSLRKALSVLRQAIGDQDASTPFLLAERATVQFNPAGDYWLDVDALTSQLEMSETHPHYRLEACESCIPHLETAVTLYRGDFLQGVIVADSVEFEDWLLVHREHFHSRVLTALHHLTRHYTQRGKYGRAQRYALRQISMEPYREEAHQELMRVLARSGQRSAALAQYETCRQILAKELGVEPSHQTQALYRRIRSARETRPHNLSLQLIPLIGRGGEQEIIAERLANPDCRLLTLTGSGGIGKTRLALHAARKHLVDFLHGVFFVPLVAVRSVAKLPTAIVDALPCTLDGQTDPETLLLDYLREKSLLLVLDNLEHLLAGAGSLNKILRAAPHVKLLVTSRERL